MSVIAVYAAVVATLALLWQIVSHLRSERTALTVSVAADYLTLLRASGQSEEPPGVVFIVLNHSRHDLPMPGFALTQQTIGWPVTAQDLAEPLPATLAARSSVSFRVPLSRFVGVEAGQPVVAWATTATGKSFVSKPTVIGHAVRLTSTGIRRPRAAHVLATAGNAVRHPVRATRSRSRGIGSL